MRGFYGLVKAVTFGWIFLVQPWPTLFPELWANWGDTARLIANLLVYVSVTLCIVRGLPVILECLVETKVIKLKAPANANPAAQRMIRRA
jgi:CDP-diacylglycerol--glycerol-3-phosphate 3-phosphatidyltransferase